MRISSVKLSGFKRFTELDVTNIPESARLIVMAGPNGSGKSSFFDGLHTWHSTHGSPQPHYDESYHTKLGQPAMGWDQRVVIEIHGGMPTDGIEQRKLIYQRSAFRNEAEFELSQLSRLSSPLDTVRINRMIENDSTVSDNYQRLVLATLDGVYNADIPEDATKAYLRDHLIGQIRSSMMAVFPDLVLEGVGDPLQGGSFYFTKGDVRRFPYKNLSAGEKAAFDLLLDMVVKKDAFNNTAWCIDEPETHLNSRIQASLLRELLKQLPGSSQLWLASHSIGYMSAAWELYKSDPGSVVFLDFGGHDFDQPVVISPVVADRDFWKRTLDVALGDVASLVAPERIVLCEGRPAEPHESSYRARFDAACYEKIFSSEFPDTDFVSVGNNRDVTADSKYVGRAVETLAPGVAIVRVVDRDLKNNSEVEEHRRAGIRVLSHRHLECYLLQDDVLRSLCTSVGREDCVDEVLQDKIDSQQASIARGKDPDDCKSYAGDFYTRVRRRLDLRSAGSTWEAFAIDSLAPLLKPGMDTYAELKSDIFGTTEKTPKD